MTNWTRRSTHRVTGAAIALVLLAVLPPPGSAQPVVPLVRSQPVVPPARRLPISDTARCLYQDYAGFAWLCTDRGIVRFDGRTEVTFASGTSDVRAIVRGSRGGQYWVGSASGLYEMRSQGAAGTIRLDRVVAERPVAAVNALVEFSSGSIGVATDDGVLQLEDGQVSEIPFGLPEDRAGRIVHVLLEPDPVVLMAGTTSGLYLRYRDGRTRHYTTADGLPDNDVQALAFTSGGRTWIGTRRGLATIDLSDLQSDAPRPVRIFSDAEMLRNVDVRALRVLNGTSLWVGASTGLAVVMISPTKNPEVRQAGNTAVRLFSHGGSDLLVATDDGVQWIRNGPGGGRTVITGITVDGRSRAVPFDGVKHARLELPWRARLVEIHFVQPRIEVSGTYGRSPYLIRTGSSSDRDGAFSDIPETWTKMRTADEGQIRSGIFVPVSRDDFAVMLNRPSLRDVGPVVLRRSRDDGPASAFTSKRLATADTNGWLRLPDEAERRIVIEHPSRTLDAGLHRVVVYAGALPSVPGDSASVEFVVAQAPWVQWWFVGPLLLVMAAAGEGYRRLRHRRKEEIVRLRTRIATDLHDSVGASLSRIAILSDVVASQVGEQNPKAGRSLKAIGDNARSVIDEMSDAVWFIDPAIHNVGDMLVRIRTVAAQLFEPDQVAWNVDAQERVANLPLTSEQRRHAYLLVKEALTNVRRHAEPSFVAVRLVMGATGLRIEIEDDGGMAPPVSGEHAGNGIANMRARAVELGGTLAIEPRLPAPGTRVVVQTNLR